MLNIFYITSVSNTTSLRQFARNRQDFEQYYLTLRQDLDRLYNQARTAMNDHLRAVRHFIRQEEDRHRPTLEQHRTDLDRIRQALQRLDLTPNQLQTITDDFNALTPQVTATTAAVVAAETRVTNNLMPDEFDDFVNLQIR
jgi:phage shock protein A